MDVVQLRLHHLRAALTAEAEDAKVVQEFVCTTPRCLGRRYSSLDAASIINPDSGQFHCEDCHEVLSLDVGEGEAGDVEERQKRKDDAKELLTRIDEEFRPLDDAIARARASGGDPPDYGSLEEWMAGRRAQAQLEAKQARMAAARGELVTGKRGRGVFDFLEDTEFDVQLEGQEEEGGGGGGAAGAAGGARPAPTKKPRLVANPPWLVRKTGLAEPAPLQLTEAAANPDDDAYRKAYLLAAIQIAQAGEASAVAAQQAAAAKPAAAAAAAAPVAAAAAAVAPVAAAAAAAAGGAEMEEEDWEDV